MFDRVLSEVPAVKLNRRKWRERLVDLFSGMLAALDWYPGIAQVGLGSMSTTPGGLAIAETALALMHAGGVPDQAAAWACDALLLYTVATAVEHAIERRPTLPRHKSPDRDYAGAARELFGSLPSDRYPNLSRMAVTMTTGGHPERFEFGLNALIRGAAAGPPDRPTNLGNYPKQGSENPVGLFPSPQLGFSPIDSERRSSGSVSR